MTECRKCLTLCLSCPNYKRQKEMTTEYTDDDLIKWCESQAGYAANYGFFDDADKFRAIAERLKELKHIIGCNQTAKDIPQPPTTG